jgi:hypothetical protein
MAVFIKFIGVNIRVHFKLSHLDNRKSLRGFGTGRMPFSIELFSLTGKTFDE